MDLRLAAIVLAHRAYATEPFDARGRAAGNEYRSDSHDLVRDFYLPCPRSGVRETRHLAIVAYESLARWQEFLFNSCRGETIVVSQSAHGTRGFSEWLLSPRSTATQAARPQLCTSRRIHKVGISKKCFAGQRGCRQRGNRAGDAAKSRAVRNTMMSQEVWLANWRT